MSKPRVNYEQTKWCKFERWVNGEERKESELSQQHEETRELFSKEEKKESAEFEANAEFEAVAEFEISAEYVEDVIQVENEKRLEALYHKYDKWPQTKGIKIFTYLYRFLAVILCLGIISMLLLTVAKLPTFGEATNPTNNEVVKRYIDKGVEETGAVNFVAGMILDYRAFDTLGESHVLFIAACCVLILLRIDRKKDGSISKAKKEAEENDLQFEPKNDKILQKTAFIVVPPIIIFGIYVILNGHLSPGGGFSGGAIIGAGLILYLNAFGFHKTSKFFTYKTFSMVTVCSLLFYIAAKGYSFYTGANHLESGIPLGTPGSIMSSGLILPLNIAVGLIVACTMFAFYSLFRKGDM